MSGVHFRDRKTTDVQYIVTARELRIELTKFLRNQKNIPKSDRYLIAMPIIEKARELSLNCTAANAVFPVDERTLNKRKDYLIAAWIAAQQLQEDLIVCIETVQTANVAKLSAKKTRIVPFKDGIEWLKTRFSVTDTGKILKRPAPALITRERRKLKRQKKILTPEELYKSFVSWSGCMLRRNARRSVFNMRRLLED